MARGFKIYLFFLFFGRCNRIKVGVKILSFWDSRNKNTNLKFYHWMEKFLEKDSSKTFPPHPPPPSPLSLDW